MCVCKCMYVRACCDKKIIRILPWQNISLSQSCYYYSSRIKVIIHSRIRPRGLDFVLERGVFSTWSVLESVEGVTPTEESTAQHCTGVTYRYKRKIEAWLRNHCWCGKVLSIIYYECVCMCSRSYPACKAHAQCYPWSVWFSRIFSHLINGTIFRETLFNINVRFDFLNSSLSEHSKKNSARYHKRA